MENSVLIGVSRQVALQRELDVIANNVANVGTTGFKARSAQFREYLMPVARHDGFGGPDRRLSYVEDAGTKLDLSQGPVERTGNPLDVAVKGDGFLVVRTPGGAQRFTRSGSLDLNARGELVTPEGHRVQGAEGPITIGRDETGLQIAPDGTISSSQGVKGRLQIVTFQNPGVLRSEGANLFSTTAQSRPAGRDGRLEVGALERSNVKAVVEMSRLVEVSRAYQTVAALVQRTEDLRRNAIERLGSVPT